jgi:uracil-DNA glycosylase
MDGAVAEIWSEDATAGLSKSVNRATSLRNFIKMLLVADGQLSLDDTSCNALTTFVRQVRQEPDKYVQTMAQLQDNFLKRGFLMLNASLVFRSDVSPAEDAKVWRVFLQYVFEALAQQSTVPSLILWGKIADRLESVVALSKFEKFKSEHPYNLSFIGNLSMHQLFAPMNLMRK